ncbi:MAG: MFS transporter [Rhodospirillaceae bacterium]|nr:MFS transporter [Rhodospirillaceae bacterium]
MSTPDGPSSPQPVSHSDISLWAPLQIRDFRLLYIALFVTNVGGWMNGIGCAWLMTSLDNRALMLGLVQASFMLPSIFFSLLGGVLADKVDRRRYIIALSCVIFMVALDLSLLTWLGWIRPWSLLAHTLVIGSVFALQGPAIMSVIQDLVKREMLPQALTLNSIALNVGRSVGPMFAGAMISALGSASVFLVNTIGYAGLGAFFLSRGQTKLHQPSREGFGEALWNGVRFAVTERGFRGMLIRLTLISSCMSSLLSLMPLVAKEQLGGGPSTFGTLVTWIGVGSVLVAFGRNRLTGIVTPNMHVHLSVAGAGLAYIGLAVVHDLTFAAACAFVYGIAWTNVSITFQVGTQMRLPAAMRGRGISLFIMTFSLGILLGGVVWGLLADLVGIKIALIGSGIGTILFNLMTYRLSMNTQPPSAPT